MTARATPSSHEYLARRHPHVSEAFFDHLRPALEASGSLDKKTKELVMLAGYVVAGQPRAFSVHLRRALQAGADADQVRQTVLLTLGASATLEQVVNALWWVDQEFSETDERHDGVTEETR